MADYSSCDSSNLNDFLSSIHPEYSAYTYTLLNNHVDKDTLRKCVNEDVLAECGVKNSIDRRRIMDALKGNKNFENEFSNLGKVFKICKTLVICNVH